MSLFFAPLRCFTTTFQVQFDIFQPLMSLTIESTSMAVTGSILLSGVSLSVLPFEFWVFLVAVLIAYCFAVTFVFGESVSYFHYQLGSPQFLMVNSDFCFLLIYYSWLVFFKGSLLALEIPDFVGISSCRILFSICINNFC